MTSTTTSVPLALLPSPTQGVWQVGPVPLRAYALCLLLGIVVAMIITERRLRSRGVAAGVGVDVAMWAVPAGILGARIYHVLTSPGRYFGADGDPVIALYVWEGGLGIWGAIAGGAVGAWYGCRRAGIPLSTFADALAPALPVAQAIGRWGNWFNNELYGGPTDVPWGLRIYQWAGGRAATDTSGDPIVKGVFHPTFLYESLWNLGVAALVWALDRRLRFGRGRAFAVYAMAYTAGRFWIEGMRIDPAQQVLGLRLNQWTAAVVFLAAAIYFAATRASDTPVDAPDPIGNAAINPAFAAQPGPSPDDGPAPAGTHPAALPPPKAAPRSEESDS
jgi:prolipoprotein diacylglyceryl transferase